MVDLRRESLLIDKHQGELQRSIGHTFTWRCHLPGQDVKDPIYGVASGAGIAWSAPFDVPVIWTDTNEANIRTTADRRDLTVNIRFTLSMSQMEALSSMLDPHNVGERLLDIFHFRGRWHKVVEWNIQNLLGTDDKNIFVAGVQMFPEQDFVNSPSVDESVDYNPTDSGVSIVL